MKWILRSLLVATLPLGSVLADAPKGEERQSDPRLPARAAERSRQEHQGVFVEYGPGGYSPGHTHPKSAFIYATVLEGAIHGKVNDGPVTPPSPQNHEGGFYG